MSTAVVKFGFGDLCASFSEPLRVRDERILTVPSKSPFRYSALYSIIEGHSATEHMLEVKELEIEQTRQRIELSVLEIYLQTLEMQAQREILNDTLERLSKHERSVQAFVAQCLAHSVQAKELSHAIRQTKMGMKQLDQGFALLCKQMELLLGLETPLNQNPCRTIFWSRSKLQSSLTHRLHTSVRHKTVHKRLWEI